MNTTENNSSRPARIAVLLLNTIFFCVFAWLSWVLAGNDIGPHRMASTHLFLPFMRHSFLAGIRWILFFPLPWVVATVALTFSRRLGWPAVAIHASTVLLGIIALVALFGSCQMTELDEADNVRAKIIYEYQHTQPAQ